MNYKDDLIKRINELIIEYNEVSKLLPNFTPISIEPETLELKQIENLVEDLQQLVCDVTTKKIRSFTNFTDNLCDVLNVCPLIQQVGLVSRMTYNYNTTDSSLTGLCIDHFTVQPRKTDLSVPEVIEKLYECADGDWSAKDNVNGYFTLNKASSAIAMRTRRGAGNHILLNKESWEILKDFDRFKKFFKPESAPNPDNKLIYKLGSIARYTIMYDTTDSSKNTRALLYYIGPRQSDRGAILATYLDRTFLYIDDVTKNYYTKVILA